MSATPLSKLEQDIYKLPLDEQLRLVERLVQHIRGAMPGEKGAAVRVEADKPGQLEKKLLAIGQMCAALPLLDTRPPAEILGYNDVGAPS